MKNFLLCLFLASSTLVTANNRSNDNMEIKTVAEDVLLGHFEKNINDLVLPWTISVPAPPSDIINIYGPCGPNTASWSISNGYLYIIVKPSAYVHLCDGATSISQ